MSLAFVTTQGAQITKELCSSAFGDLGHQEGTDEPLRYYCSALDSSGHQGGTARLGGKQVKPEEISAEPAAGGVTMVNTGIMA